MPTPGKLTGTAVTQLVSGLVNLFVMWWLGGMVVGLGCGAASGVVTLGMCPFGGLCGFVPWLLIPLGVFELVGGIIGLANPKGGGKMLRIVAFAELAGVLVGGFGSLVAGGLSLFLLSDGEVKAFLEER